MKTVGATVSSPLAAFAAGALFSVTAIGAGYLLYRLSSSSKVSDAAIDEIFEKEFELDFDINDNSTDKQNDQMLDELKKEQLSRNTTFFSEKNQLMLENAFIIVVGLGGVGSHAAHLLARCGVKKLRIIDFDQVTLSSLNRHAVAVRADVGTSKAKCMQKYIRKIAPWCEVEAVVEMFKKDAAASLLLNGNEKPDYVLDCIDDLTTKIDLLHFCCSNNLRVMSSCGAGAKADPTRLHISNLADVINDPLATRIKLHLRVMFREAISHGIGSSRTEMNRLPENIEDENEEADDEGSKAEAALFSKMQSLEVVYSSEKPRMKLLPLDNEVQKDSPEEFGTVDNFRIRIMPVLGTMPAIFGIAMASRVVTNLAKKPYLPSTLPAMTPATSERLRHRFCLRLCDALAKRNNRLADDVMYDFKRIDSDDIEFVVIEFKRRCVITFERWQRNRIELALWNFKKNVEVDNIVLVRKDFAEKLDDLVVKREEPTPESLGITKEHFESILQQLYLIGQFNPRPRTPDGILL